MITRSDIASLKPGDLIHRVGVSLKIAWCRPFQTDIFLVGKLGIVGDADCEYVALISDGRPILVSIEDGGFIDISGDELEKSPEVTVESPFKIECVFRGFNT